MTKRALFIGRFQPFHNGHLDAMKQIVEHPDGYAEIIIGIGSAETDHTADNPLTAGERTELIDLALQEEDFRNVKFWIIPIRDINDYPAWPHHVVRLCPRFDAIFSGSELVMRLFREAFPDKEIKVYELKKRLDISATQVRERILKGESVKDLIPEEVEEYLRRLNLNKRCKK